MRKDQLKFDVDYAYWDGHGGFAIPRTGRAAEVAFDRTLRVRVLDTEAPARSDDYLIPPKSTGVLFKVLDRDGNDTHQRIARNAGPFQEELVTRWQPTARHFVMEWDELTKLVRPLLDDLAVKLAREATLHETERATRKIIAARLRVPQKLVSVEIYEYTYRDGITERVSIDVSLENFADLSRLGVEVPARPEGFEP